MPTPIRSRLLEALSPRLRYGFSTKPLSIAGLPPEGADAASIWQEQQAHRAACVAAFGLASDTPLCYPQQVHGTAYFKTSEAHQQQRYTAEVDAIWLDAPQQPALIYTADCTPVILYSPCLHQGMLLHCGWKSTALGLGSQMATLLQEAGAAPERCIAVIGPALSAAGFEVGEEVIDALAASLPAETPQSLWAWQHPDTHRWHADVVAVNRLQLFAQGLQHIEALPYATDTHPSLFWSFRRGDWQRQGTFLQLT